MFGEQKKENQHTHDPATGTFMRMAVAWSHWFDFFQRRWIVLLWQHSQRFALHRLSNPVNSHDNDPYGRLIFHRCSHTVLYRHSGLLIVIQFEGNGLNKQHSKVLVEDPRQVKGKRVDWLSFRQVGSLEEGFAQPVERSLWEKKTRPSQAKRARSISMRQVWIRRRPCWCLHRRS